MWTVQYTVIGIDVALHLPIWPMGKENKGLDIGVALAVCFCSFLNSERVNSFQLKEENISQ